MRSLASYFIVQKKNKKKMPLSVYEYPRCKPYLSQDQQQKYESYLNIINKSGKITDYFWKINKTHLI